jgi:hypothetical protein
MWHAFSCVRSRISVHLLMFMYACVCVPLLLRLLLLLLILLLLFPLLPLLPLLLLR